MEWIWFPLDVGWSGSFYCMRLLFLPSGPTNSCGKEYGVGRVQTLWFLSISNYRKSVVEFISLSCPVRVRHCFFASWCNILVACIYSTLCELLFTAMLALFADFGNGRWVDGAPGGGDVGGHRQRDRDRLRGEQPVSGSENVLAVICLWCATHSFIGQSR